MGAGHGATGFVRKRALVVAKNAPIEARHRPSSYFYTRTIESACISRRAPRERTRLWVTDSVITARQESTCIFSEPRRLSNRASRRRTGGLPNSARAQRPLWTPRTSVCARRRWRWCARLDPRLIQPGDAPLRTSSRRDLMKQLSQSHVRRGVRSSNRRLRAGPWSDRSHQPHRAYGQGRGQGGRLSK
jgi:hypothetical protein